MVKTTKVVKIANPILFYYIYITFGKYALHLSISQNIIRKALNFVFRAIFLTES